MTYGDIGRESPYREREAGHSPLASENLSIIWKRWKITGKLVLITNRKSYMVPKLVTLNDLERRNNHYFALFRRIR